MPNSIFDARPLRDEAAAYAYVEARIWRKGRVCPHCGVVDKSGLLKGKSTRIGVYKCYACRKPFTVKVGTIFEDSHVPLHIWLQAVVLRNADPKSKLMTDDRRSYPAIGGRFASHGSVNHSAEEWVRGDVHVNTAEGFFSIFKRGMVGVYQHCTERHLHRYLAEFDFRYSNRVAVGVDDAGRTERR